MGQKKLNGKCRKSRDIVKCQKLISRMKVEGRGRSGVVEMRVQSRAVLYGENIYTGTRAS